MSAPRGFITLTTVHDLRRVRVAASSVVAYIANRNELNSFVTVGADEYKVTESPEQIDALIAAAQGDGATAEREELPPLVVDARMSLSKAYVTAPWPDRVTVDLASEEARALLDYLDRRGA